MFQVTHMKIMKYLRINLLKFVRRGSPFLTDCISGWKMYKHTKTFHAKEQNAFAEAFYGGHMPCVLGGPFKGMLYENRTYFGPVTPRWLGSYEKELLQAIESIRKFNPDVIIDIGAAEGYYSIGLARMFPSAKVVSYETNPLSLWQQRALKRLNKAANLLIRRYCSQKDLSKHGENRCFVLSDIEGCELDLFSDEVAASLRSSVVLIELHSYGNLDIDSVASILEQRFTSTHSVSYITPVCRTAKDIEIEYPLTFDDQRMVSAMNEWRSQAQKWMYCVPRESH
jgi:hypothetical protein